MTNRLFAVLIVTAALVIGAAIALTPTGLFRVYPTVVYLAELGGWPPLLVPVFAAAFFIIWNLPLVARRSDPGDVFFPRRSYVLAGSGLVFSVMHYGVQWEWAETYIASDLYTAVLLSACAFVLVVVAVAVAARTRGIIAHVVTHFLLFFWLFIFAFPFLSEPCC